MITLHTQAKGSGRVVSWNHFKQGKLVNQSRISFTATTVLTDVIAHVFAVAEKIDPNLIFRTLIPNGPTTASFDIAIDGSEFQINCSRRLVRGGFPTNPFAAEFGSNYDVIITISSPKHELEESLSMAIKSQFACI